MQTACGPVKLMSMDTKEDLLAARFRLNMQRIAGLTKLVFPGGGAAAPTAAAIESDDVRADLFRAIVVFLHATFEDGLRTAARQRLADAAPKVLEDIPLVGTTKLRRAEKFHLGSLAAHRGKTVDHLIRESVEEYLTRESFGSCADVEEILRQMGLDTKPFKSLYPYLDGMMKRRHRIVHEADLPSPLDTFSPPWTTVDLFELGLWNLAVLAFHALLRVSLDPADELQRWYFERRTKAIELFRQSPTEIAVLPDQYADAKSMIVGFQRRVEEVMQQVIAQLKSPSQEELLALAERIMTKKAE
jgi:hypothetical protein